MTRGNPPRPNDRVVIYGGPVDHVGTVLDVESDDQGHWVFVAIDGEPEPCWRMDVLVEKEESRA